ncbi:hypothetical protein [Pedobacter insulae]|uniref:hypothetical protein n=1 Tax=Pedobacter insulae TaxID=414048 RepID=UPI000B815792|nr:hypothetical protein [Pedobacter insulae]
MKKPSKELIEATANAIMQHFIPKSIAEQRFSFHFTIPPAFNFKANYELNEKHKWVLVGYEEDNSI